MNKAVFLTKQIIDSYIDICFSMICVRHPAMHEAILKIIPGVQIESSYSSDGIKQDLLINTAAMIESFEGEGLNNPQNLKTSFKQINSMFLIAMWSILVETEEFKSISTEKEIQFFRHIRNGCAHGNQLNFKKLDHDAKWRDKAISMEHKNLPVFPNILKDGDPMLLMLDINNKFFKPAYLPGIVEYQEHK